MQCSACAHLPREAPWAPFGMATRTSTSPTRTACWARSPAPPKPSTPPTAPSRAPTSAPASTTARCARTFTLRASLTTTQKTKGGTWASTSRIRIFPTRSRPPRRGRRTSRRAVSTNSAWPSAARRRSAATARAPRRARRTRLARASTPGTMPTARWPTAAATEMAPDASAPSARAPRLPRKRGRPRSTRATRTSTTFFLKV